MKWPRRELLRNAKMKRDASTKTLDAAEIVQQGSQSLQPEAVHATAMTAGVGSPRSSSGPRPQPQVLFVT